MMKNLNLLLIFNLIVFSNLSCAHKNLAFEKISFNRDNIELSALFKKHDDLLFVADKLSNRAIYKVVFEQKTFYYKEIINFSNLKGHNSYFASALLLKHAGKILNIPFDLEGLAACGETYYVANERVRHILKISNGKLEKLDIDFSSIFKKAGFPLNKISNNAGFEGIDIDCEAQTLYIAQERSPRGILIYDLKNKKFKQSILFENINTKWGSADFADLHYSNGFLYLLERNAHLVTKYDLKKNKIVSSVSFGNLKNIHLRELYDTNEIFGLAEGLSMTNDQIIIGIDNNKNKISKKGQKAFETKGDFSSIIFYKRPKGF
jgi:hypothetical protein